MTRLDRLLLILALVAIVLVALLSRVSPTDSRQTPTWTPDPSAISPITAIWSPPEQTPVPTVIGLPRWSAEPKPAMKLGRVTMPASPTPGAAASHSLADLVRTGTASTYGDQYGPQWVALPQGPGVRFRVCGQAACLVLLSTDKGPDQLVFPDRIVDLPVWAFERVSGQPWTRGITSVSVTILGRAP